MSIRDDNDSLSVKNLIGLALERKQISNNYQSNAYPYFLRSQGPFRIYDHAQAKGKNYVGNIQAINEQARQRLEKEYHQIKEVRSFEREEFGWQKKKQDIIALQNIKMKKHNNMANLYCLAEQIEQDRVKKNFEKEMEKQYYKTHFGPEETDELI
jgi:CTP:phosphocholine cytidylyltransferase-like protein